MDKKIVRSEVESQLESYLREMSKAQYEFFRKGPDKAAQIITTNYDRLLEFIISYSDEHDLSDHEKKILADVRNYTFTKTVDGGVDIEFKSKADSLAATVARRMVENFRGLLTFTSATRTRLTKRAPGTNLLRFVDFFFAASTMEKTFKPLVADWRTEYFEALQQGRTRKARWISVRYMWAFMLAMGLSRIMTLFKKFSSAK